MPRNAFATAALSCCLAFTLTLLAVAESYAAKIPAPPRLSAKAFLMIDADSGRVLVENNADQTLGPASLTKLMTSYVLAYELGQGNVSNDDMVLVSENAWAQNPIFEGSSLMWIEVGKTVRLEDLHRGIVISSGNDATVAVAEHIAGSESAFADLMNQHARDLGMTGTNFVNSHGLPHPDHYTTARDLAILAEAFIERFPVEYEMYREREFTYNGIRQYNRNVLMAEDPSVDGLKTGHTEDAGYCLVASAKRQGMRLITVVMGTDSERARKRETKNLLSYGFRFFQTGEIAKAAQVLTQTKVWKGVEDSLALGLSESVSVTAPRGLLDEVQATPVVNSVVEAPVAIGDVLGHVEFAVDGEILAERPLVALAAIEQAGFFARLWDGFMLWLGQLLGSVTSE